ncbi:D-methionine transport system permease protein MetI [Helicobacter canadensis MIT 98-5491]|uniref:ABC transporter, permease protein n=2 Tax=Helicobacter canadensis TaxID=123841 RepID=C5ZWD8_9HELI|nr:ABC transporter, permease protein [Helicobacter canadensis MIT 98-5491]EFR48247.1 D-methionine transport system permease protein MetI [Helicobacter canadensis MIT 98-5491]STO99494.1 ABC transporter permease protein [Helicobacter canadensis]
MKEFLKISDRIFEDLLLQIFGGSGIPFLIAKATLETLYMVGFSVLFAIIFGLPLGIFLALTRKDGIKPLPAVNHFLSVLVNLIRSFPFIILILVILPFSNFLIGISTGSTAAIIPLSIAAIPFIARLFEGAFLEIKKDLIEATQSMGANLYTIIKMMIAEAKPALINCVIITLVSLVGYSAMAGVVGAGGLGDLAYRLGFQSFKVDILLYSVLVIIILVQIIQSIGDMIVKMARKYY